jgi:hypothetical protein
MGNQASDMGKLYDVRLHFDSIHLPLGASLESQWSVGIERVVTVQLVKPVEQILIRSSQLVSSR